MERHVQNAVVVANWLEARDEVSWVAYPGLASSPWHERQLSICPWWWIDHRFRHQGRTERRTEFIEGLELFSHLANVGDVRSLAIHPASTTHSQLTEEADDDRCESGSRASLCWTRDDRRHPGGPRRRIPCREGWVRPTLFPGTWQPGDDPVNGNSLN